MCVRACVRACVRVCVCCDFYFLLTYPLHAVWHIRLTQDLTRPLCLGLSLLLCHMLTQQPSVLPLFVATLFSACLFFCFLLASRFALFLLADRCSSCRHYQAIRGTSIGVFLLHHTLGHVVTSYGLFSHRAMMSSSAPNWRLIMLPR